jgi:hypothetical protein
MDAELPLEVDDEYWIMNDEDLTFKQPEGKPSANTAFNLWIKLNQIIAFAVRTIVRAVSGFICLTKVTLVLVCS